MCWWRCSAQNKDSANVAHPVYSVLRMEEYTDGERMLFKEVYTSRYPTFFPTDACVNPPNLQVSRVQGICYKSSMTCWGTS